VGTPTLAQLDQRRVVVLSGEKRATCIPFDRSKSEDVLIKIQRARELGDLQEDPPELDSFG
jgi:hypothetical protein